MSFGITIGLILINIFTIYKYLFLIFFHDFEDFDESLRYTLTPDIISLFRGEYWKDQFSELKLSMFILSCIIATAIEYLIVKGIIQWILGLK